MLKLSIHPDLRHLLLPLSADERTQLISNLRAEGCRDALVVWEEENAILDGHNRYDICETYELPYRIEKVSLPNLEAAKAWMLRHQLGRRNLTLEQASYLRGKEQELVGQHRTGPPSNNLDNNCLNKTNSQLAQEHKVHANTIKNDAAYAKSVDAIAAVAPEAKQAILARDTQLDRKDVKALADIAEESPQAAKHIFAAIAQAPTRKEKKGVLREAIKARPALPRAPRPARSSVVSREAVALPVAVPFMLTPESVPKSGLEEILSTDKRPMFILHKPDSKPVFNRTNEMVDWASWTWNPVTGCWHGCDYCYAREIAHDERMAEAYPKQFEPTFHPARLHAPANTSVPKVLTRPADKNVFTCSMADLFGKWVPDAWIMQVFERVTLHQEWNFLFLTKFPQRLAQVGDLLGGFPPNAWLGCTVDAQARVTTAERAFQQMDARIKWLSVEPMNERLTFKNLEVFDWLVMGGQTASAYNGTPARQPEWEWVEHLWQQARAAQVKIYWKENLTIRPKEMPWDTK